MAEGDRVVARIRAQGTHTGEIFGRPPTGKVVARPGISIYRIADGRIAEHWTEQGQGILEQLGLEARVRRG